MINHLALSVRSALARTFAPEVRRASEVAGTLAVALAFVTATGQRGACVPWQTAADSHLIDHLAFCVQSTRIRFAGGLRISYTAGGERISGLSRWTVTRRHVVPRLADGVRATKTIARVHASVVRTDLAAAAVFVYLTLDSDATRQRIPHVQVHAGANGPALAVSASCVHSTGVSLAGADASRCQYSCLIVSAIDDSDERENQQYCSLRAIHGSLVDLG